MLQLIVIESTAEGRNSIVKQITGYLQTEIPGLEMVPRLSINPLSIEEVKYSPEPNICIIGEDIATKNPAAIRSLKESWANTATVVQVADYVKNITALESLARMGVDDTISTKISPAEFLGKLLILSQRKKTKKQGKLILVESGKGGMGVTSIVAGLGESMSQQGKKVLMLDFDLDTQDLSRYLQARPYVNENLHNLFFNNVAITKESVEECLVPVWYDSDLLYCMPPCSSAEKFLNQHTKNARTLIGMFEVLDEIFDVIIVDPGCLRGSLLSTLYRLSDEVLFIINNDPATLYPSVSKYRKIKELLSLNVDPIIIDNASKRGGLSSNLLHTEFNRASGCSENIWNDKKLPFCTMASRWPGSKVSMYSLGGRKIQKAFKSVLESVGVVEESKENSIFEFIKEKLRRKSLPAPLIALPENIETVEVKDENDNEDDAIILPKIDEDALLNDNEKEISCDDNLDIDSLVLEPQVCS